MMQLYKDIIIDLLKNDSVEVNNKYDTQLNSIVEMKCYNTLKQIQMILKDDNLSDKECFQKIEAIVSVFEKIGSDCGCRHDF